MKGWLRKLFVMTVACLTLGLYVPSLNVETEQDVVKTAKEIDLLNLNPDRDDTSSHLTNREVRPAFTTLESLITDATHATLNKIGPKILASIKQEVNHELIPNLELVLTDLVGDFTPDGLASLSVVEYDETNFGEKIFNIYDDETEQNIALFHVIRINKPLEGHFFQFHYHLDSDEFNHHYPLAEIFYGKNMPPRWRA